MGGAITGADAGLGRARTALPPLLATKLTPPSPRPGALARPRLVARLAAGARGRLTLLSAQAGSGKTTLLAAWLAGARAAGRAIAWVALDAGDSDPARFWRYVLAALDGAVPGVASGALALLAGPESPPVEVVLATLLNALAAAGTDVALALDDYHAIAALPIHEGLAFLLANQPPNLHLVIASRADPPLPLARWRARGELTELRAADLHFDATEAADFLS